VNKDKKPLSVTHPELAKQAVAWDSNSYSYGSHKVVDWRCTQGHVWKAAIKTRAIGGNNCPTCSGHVVLPGFNDLETLYPKIAKLAFEWDPSTVTAMSGKQAKWKCKFNHVTETRIANKVLGTGCPVCSGHQLLEGFNDLETVFPDVAKEADGWNPRKITKGHDKKLNWKCSKGHKWSATVFSRTGKDKVNCPICSGKKILSGHNDLQTLFPEIAKEADGWDPRNISPGNNKKFSWKCKKGHKWKTSPYQRTARKSGCLICSNLKVLISYNDLKTTHPDLALQADGWDPETVTAGYGKKLKWKCNLNHDWVASVESRTARKTGCPYCAGKKVLPGFNDLKTRYPEIAKQAEGWDTSLFISGSHTKKKWKCNLNHSYTAPIISRTGGSKSSCPICDGKQVLIGFNDFKSKFPELALQAYDWNPQEFTSGSSKKVKWKCPEGHIWKASLSDRTGNHKSGCPSCAKGGFDPNQNGYLYFLIQPKWEIYQIGITNVPEDRLNRHSKNGFELLEIRGPMDGHTAQELETAILRYLKSQRADLSPDHVAGKFDGYSESWTIDSFQINTLKELIDRTREAGY
jgi:hypothetical protein